MENRIEIAELSQRELETVTGGKRVEMNGDTWESNGDGHPHRVTSNWSIFTWLFG